MLPFQTMYECSLHYCCDLQASFLKYKMALLLMMCAFTYSQIHIRRSGGKQKYREQFAIFTVTFLVEYRSLRHGEDSGHISH